MCEKVTWEKLLYELSTSGTESETGRAVSGVASALLYKNIIRSALSFDSRNLKISCFLSLVLVYFMHVVMNKRKESYLENGFMKLPVLYESKFWADLSLEYC